MVQLFINIIYNTLQAFLSRLQNFERGKSTMGLITITSKLII